jgi:hypothetical protein
MMTLSELAPGTRVRLTGEAAGRFVSMKEVCDIAGKEGVVLEVPGVVMHVAVDWSPSFAIMVFSGRDLEEAAP